MDRKPLPPRSRHSRWSEDSTRYQSFDRVHAIGRRDSSVILRPASPSAVYSVIPGAPPCTESITPPAASAAGGAAAEPMSVSSSAASPCGFTTGYAPEVVDTKTSVAKMYSGPKTSPPVRTGCTVGELPREPVPPSQQRVKYTGKVVFRPANCPTRPQAVAFASDVDTMSPFMARTTSKYLPVRHCPMMPPTRFRPTMSPSMAFTMASYEGTPVPGVWYPMTPPAMPALAVMLPFILLNMPPYFWVADS